MIIEKSELARAINRVKGIVTKNAVFPALEGVLIKDGYMTASNMEITMQVKLKGTEGEEFILPMQAFDLINNLPDGDIEVTANPVANTVTIIMDRIKNSYRTMPADTFSFYRNDVAGENGIRIDGKRIVDAFGHVIFAAADKSDRQMMTGVYLRGSEDGIEVAALDGHVISLDRIAATGTAGAEMIIPKSAVKRLLSMGLFGMITICFDKNSAVFESDEGVIYTRLIEGKYFPYEKMLKSPTYTITVRRKDLADAVTRAKMCVDETMRPAVFEVNGNEMSIAVTSGKGEYRETIDIQADIPEPIRIGFDAKLILESVKAFSCADIDLGFINAKAPMIMSAADTEMKVAVLPVLLGPGTS